MAPPGGGEGRGQICSDFLKTNPPPSPKASAILSLHTNPYLITNKTPRLNTHSFTPTPFPLSHFPFPISKKKTPQEDREGGGGESNDYFVLKRTRSARFRDLCYYSRKLFLAGWMGIWGNNGTGSSLPRGGEFKLGYENMIGMDGMGLVCSPNEGGGRP